jgi:endonuclease YncB( thermonuclease family)
VHWSALLSLLICTAGIIGAPASSAQNQIIGKARTIDGDTIDVAGVRVRLWGVDAPESKQFCEAGNRRYACGTDATSALARLIGDQTLTCRERGRDRWQRVIAVCLAGGKDLGKEMVRIGWALAFIRYSSDYVTEEREAQRDRLGLWAGSFVPPWDWRQ